MNDANPATFETAKPASDPSEPSPVEALRKEVSALEMKVAEVKPVTDVVRMLLYFWAAISVILGLFGWKQFSDIENMVSKQVQLTLPSDKAKYAQYEQLIDETQKLYGAFEKLTQTYKERVKDLNFASTVSKDFDIEGQVMKIVAESDVEGNEDDSAWRTRAIFVISNFRDSMATQGFSADFIFNVAQVCRQLKQFQLARELTEAANKSDSSPPIRAMYLSSKIVDARGEEREKAFSDLMGMITNLSYNSPHIVLAEAWNAAEDQRKYGSFIAAVTALISARGSEVGSEKYVPSYAYIIAADTHLRQGIPGSIGKAKELLKEGLKRLSNESPKAQWFTAALVQAGLVREVIENSEEMNSKFALLTSSN